MTCCRKFSQKIASLRTLIREFREEGGRCDMSSLEKLIGKLSFRKAVIIMLIIEFFIVNIFLFVSLVQHFLYVDSAGRAGFINIKSIRYHDIFHYRRYQEWELKVPIDWDIEDRRHVNETRAKLDEMCSSYSNNASLPGDPGDYIREVAGHPNTSGYNRKLKTMFKLWTSSVLLMYFSCPLILLAVWWKEQRDTLVLVFMLLRSFSPILLAIIVLISRDKLLCAIDIIYLGHPFRTSILIATVILIVYNIGEFVTLGLFCLEYKLELKRENEELLLTKINRQQIIKKRKSAEEIIHAENKGHEEESAAPIGHSENNKHDAAQKLQQQHPSVSTLSSKKTTSTVSIKKEIHAKKKMLK